MKRRDFFKAVTGFVAGVFAAFVPKAKANLNNLKLLPSSVRKRNGTKFIDEWPGKNNLFLLPLDGKWTHAVICSPDNEPRSFELYLNGKRIK